MLVATAGHIDHGKTSLIRAITGVETDRLPEERARGISIDLGFAHWRPDEGAMLSFIDVPGHERYVRNMLAGVSAVDLALLVVAADDGVMPQTVEHVQILNLLGIDRGIVAITKIDRVGADRVAQVRDQVQALLASTPLAGSAMFEVSAVTGAGVSALAEALSSRRADHGPRVDAGRHFRLAIDRVFSVAGAGTIVTGTAVAGCVEVGARLTVSPSGIEARVRGLQSGGANLGRVEAGQRCAINLVGVDVEQVRRGDWLLPPEMHAPTQRMEVTIRVLPARAEALKHQAQLHLHIGTTDVAAKVLIRGSASIAPGEQGLAQLVLSRPIAAVNGERFVLRDASGRVSIGGGQIVDPFISGERREQVTRPPIATALMQGAPRSILAALLEIEGHEPSTRQFERTLNLTTDAAQDVYRQAGAVQIGTAHPVLLSAARAERIADQIVETLSAYHGEQPDEIGMLRRDLKERIGTVVSPQVFVLLLKEMTERRQVEMSGAFVKLPSHAARMSPADTALWQRLQPRLDERGIQPFTVREVADDLRVPEGTLKSLVYRLRDNGDLWHIYGERFLPRAQVAALAATAAGVDAEFRETGFTAAQFRDAIGTGRTLAIHILECFDNIGVTHRHGDLRKMRRDYELIVGTSPRYQLPPSTSDNPRPAPGRLAH